MRKFTGSSHGKVDCGFPEPKPVFDLDANWLVRQRDWIENAIDELAKHLTELTLASLTVPKN
jgi:hypothetical protein